MFTWVLGIRELPLEFACWYLPLGLTDGDPCKGVQQTDKDPMME